MLRVQNALLFMYRVQQYVEKRQNQGRSGAIIEISELSRDVTDLKAVGFWWMLYPNGIKRLFSLSRKLVKKFPEALWRFDVVLQDDKDDEVYAARKLNVK